MLFLLISALAFVGGSSTGRAEGYLTSCEGLLAGLQKGSIESFFVKEPLSEEQMAQLLFDYGLLFSGEFQAALGLSLQGDGIPKSGELIDGKRAIAAAKTLRSKTQLSENEYSVFLNKILENIEHLGASSEAEPNSRIRHLQIRELRKAIANSPNQKVFETVLKKVVNATLIVTAQEILTRGADQLHSDLDTMTNFQSMRFGFIFIGLTAAIAYAIPHLIFQVLPGLHSSWWPYVADVPGIWLGGAMSYETADWVHHIPEKYMRWRYIQEANEITSYSVSRAGNAPEPITVRGLFRGYEGTLAYAPISLKQACDAKSICKWTPVQIAYLGHLELVQLQVIKAQIQTTMKALGMHNGFDDLRDAAIQLRTDPSQYRLRARFRAEILKLVENFSTIESKVHEAIAAVNSKIDAFRPALEELQSRPYNFSAKDYSEDFVTKSELLLTKFQTDLVILEQIRMDDTQLLAALDRLRPLSEELQGTLEGKMNPQSDWAAMATDVIVALESVHFGETP